MTNEKLDELVSEAFGDSFQHKHYGKLYHHFKDNQMNHGWTVPAPLSTDISAAWCFVEKLISRYVFDLYFDDVGECWVCKLFDGQVEYKGYGTAPEAICRAALLAKKGGDYG